MLWGRAGEGTLLSSNYRMHRTPLLSLFSDICLFLFMRYEAASGIDKRGCYTALC